MGHRAAFGISTLFPLHDLPPSRQESPAAVAPQMPGEAPMDIASAQEQMLLVQSSELRRANLLRGQLTEYLAGLTQSVGSSPAAVQAAEELLGDIRKSLAAIPSGAQCSATLVSRFPQFLVSGGAAVYSAFSAGALPLKLSPCNAPGFSSPWVRGIRGNIPGAMALYVDVCIPDPGLERLLRKAGVPVTQSSLLASRALYLAGLMAYAADSLIPREEGDVTPANCWRRDSSAHYGVSFLENNPLLPLLTIRIHHPAVPLPNPFYVRFHISLPLGGKYAPLYLPSSRLLSFCGEFDKSEILEDLTQESAGSSWFRADAVEFGDLSLTSLKGQGVSCLQEARALSGSKGSALKEYAPSVYRNSACMLGACYGSEALRAAVLDVLDSDVARASAVLLHSFLVLHGIAPSLKSSPLKGLGHSPSLGLLPLSGPGFLASCALTALVCVKSPIAQNAADAPACFRAVISHFAASGDAMLETEEWLEPKIVTVDAGDGSQDGGAADALPQASLTDAERGCLRAYGAPMLLTHGSLDVRAPVNLLAGFTRGAWKRFTSICRHAYRSFVDASALDGDAQLFSMLLPPAVNPALGPLPIEAPHGFDMFTVLRFRAEGPMGLFIRIANGSILDVGFAPRYLEALFSAALLQTGRAESVEVGIIPTSQRLDKTGVEPLYPISEPPPRIDSCCFLLAIKLSHMSRYLPIHRGPRLLGADVDHAACASYMALFGDKVESRRFSDGSKNFCTLWGVPKDERGVELPAHLASQAHVRDIEKLVTRRHLGKAVALARRISDSSVLEQIIPDLVMLEQDSERIRACARDLEEAIRVASEDCRDLPLTVQRVEFSDKFARGTALERVVHREPMVGGLEVGAEIGRGEDRGADDGEASGSEDGGGEAEGDSGSSDDSGDSNPSDDPAAAPRAAPTPRTVVVTGMIVVDAIGSWPRDLGAVACLKTLILSRICDQLTKRAPPASRVQAIAQANGWDPDSPQYQRARTYLPRGAKASLRASCLDLDVPLERAFIPRYESLATNADSVLFRLFIAAPADVALCKLMNTPVGDSKAEYMRAYYSVVPRHARAISGLVEQSRGYREGCLLAKRWAAAHMVPLYDFAPSFMDAIRSPVATQAFEDALDGAGAEKELEEAIKGSSGGRSLFSACAAQEDVANRLIPPSNIAARGFLSEEAIEILAAYPLTMAKGENLAMPQSGLGVFRAFLRLLCEIGRSIPYVDISRQVEAAENLESALPTRDRLQWVHFPGKPRGSNGAATPVMPVAPTGPAETAEIAASTADFSGSCVIDLIADLEAAFPRPEVEHVDSQESRDPQEAERREKAKRRRQGTGLPAASYEGLTRAEKDELELMGNRTLRKRKYVPALLLRTSYDPSGSLFTAGVTRGLLDFLGTRARVSLRALDSLILAPQSMLDFEALFRTSVDDVQAVLPVEPVFASCGNPDWRAYGLVQEPRGRGIGVDQMPYADPFIPRVSEVLALASSQFSSDRPPAGYDPLRLILPIIGRSASSAGALRLDRYAPEAVGISLGPGGYAAVEPELDRMHDTAVGRKALVRDPSALLSSILVEAGAVFLGGGLGEEVEERRREAVSSAEAPASREVVGVVGASAEEAIGAGQGEASAVPAAEGRREAAPRAGKAEKPKRRRWRDSTGKWQKAGPAAPAGSAGEPAAGREPLSEEARGNSSRSRRSAEAPEREAPYRPQKGQSPGHSEHRKHRERPGRPGRQKR